MQLEMRVCECVCEDVKMPECQRVINQIQMLIEAEVALLNTHTHTVKTDSHSCINQIRDTV